MTVSSLSRALGSQISKELGKTGATVIMCSSISRGANYGIGKKGKTHSQRSGARNIQGVAKFMHHMAETHRHINKLVDNLGYPLERKKQDKRPHEATQEDRKKVIDIDPGDTCRLLQSMISFGINNGCSAREAGGRIINIASKSAIARNTSITVYGIAKSRLTTRTKEIALEHGDKNIRLYNFTLSSIFVRDRFSSATLSEGKKTTLENSRKMAGDSRQLFTIVASRSTVNFAFAIHNTIVADGGTVKK